MRLNGSLSDLHGTSHGEASNAHQPPTRDPKERDGLTRVAGRTEASPLASETPRWQNRSEPRATPYAARGFVIFVVSFRSDCTPSPGPRTACTYIVVSVSSVAGKHEAVGDDPVTGIARDLSP